MARQGYLGEFELIVLPALIRLGDEAYGVPIAQEIERCCGREVALAVRTRRSTGSKRKGLSPRAWASPRQNAAGRAKR
jgi:hypothetical protein